VAVEWVAYENSMALLGAGNAAEGDTIDDLAVRSHRNVRVEELKDCTGEGVAVLRVQFVDPAQRRRELKGGVACRCHG
jgi:hypothetical protein